MSLPPERAGSPADGAASERRPASVARKLGAFLVSTKLALALLVAVLVCAVLGVTVVRGARAGELIFATLWFNALLVLLAISAGAAFFSRIWRRKLTLVSVGMILFHLSFAAMLGGIVYNQLFFFRGVLRLTEGETLPNEQPESYDYVERGRFFDFGRLKGTTTLVAMHANYKIDGSNKRAAYELEVGDGPSTTRKVIYVTEYLDFAGVRYFCLKEGYSVLLVLSGQDGREIYGAHVPLQSYKQKDDTFRYATGTAAEEVAFAFPPPPAPPRADVHLAFRPSTVKERDGEVSLRVAVPGPHGGPPVDHTGRVVVGAPFEAGDVVLTPREIRYWVGMDVKYDPGLTIILASLCFGLGGMVLTFAGRVRQGARKRRGEEPRATPTVAAIEREST